MWRYGKYRLFSFFYFLFYNIFILYLLLLGMYYSNVILLYFPFLYFPFMFPFLLYAHVNQHLEDNLKTTLSQLEDNLLTE